MDQLFITKLFASGEPLTACSRDETASPTKNDESTHYTRPACRPHSGYQARYSLIPIGTRSSSVCCTAPAADVKMPILMIEAARRRTCLPCHSLGCGPKAIKRAEGRMAVTGRLSASTGVCAQVRRADGAPAPNGGAGRRDFSICRAAFPPAAGCVTSKGRPTGRVDKPLPRCISPKKRAVDPNHPGSY